MVEKYPFFKKVIPSITTSVGTANGDFPSSKDDFRSGFNGVIKND